MKRLMLIGHSEAGKTTLTQALKGQRIEYVKTHYVNFHDVIIDTPGEYAETKKYAHAFFDYGCEADVIGFLISATEQFSLFGPASAAVSTREVIGIITKIDSKWANIRQAECWLRLAGCQKIFYTDAVSGKGISELLQYLSEQKETCTSM